MKTKKILICGMLLCLVFVAGCIGNASVDVTIDKDALGNQSCMDFCRLFVHDDGVGTMKDGILNGHDCKCYRSEQERPCCVRCEE